MNSFTHEHPLMGKCMDVILEHREVILYLYKALAKKYVHKIDNNSCSYSEIISKKSEA